jgi:hypothetical protein
LRLREPVAVLRQLGETRLLTREADKRQKSGSIGASPWVFYLMKLSAADIVGSALQTTIY